MPQSVRRLPVVIVTDSSTVCKVPLTKGLVATVGPEDIAWASQRVWSKHDGKHDYAVSTDARTGRKRYLHREIAQRMGLDLSALIDHEDMVKTNNLRSNLRLASVSENRYNCEKYSSNTSGHKGVTWDRSSGKYRAQVSCRGRYYHGGYFDTAEEAAEAARNLRERLHGEFCRHE